MKKYPVVIGRFEHVDIVDKLEGLPAKIDTGAYRSSVHATNTKVIKKKGKNILQFSLLGHPAFAQNCNVATGSFRTLKVRSSNGQVALRYEVTLKIRLGYKIFTTPFTLANRAQNVFPILIGRKAMNQRFLIDPDKAGISRIELKKAAKKFILDEEDRKALNI